MPRRRVTPRRTTAALSTKALSPARRRWLVLALPVALLVAAASWALLPSSPRQLADRAQTAARAGRWSEALRDWQAANRAAQPESAWLVGEARAWLALDHAAKAEQVLAHACAANPGDPTPWLMRLGLMHVEDRTLEAQKLGWAAYAAVPSDSRRDVLRTLTLVLLSDAPEHSAREQLGRWLKADPSDIEAQVALLRRMAASPLSGDPDRAARIGTLRGLLERAPRNVGAREGLVIALAEAGEPASGLAALAAWPADARDARYYRLKGRWDLDYEHQPSEAVQAFQAALAEIPHDWRTHYRMARALRASGREAEAEREAENVSRVREALDPSTLGNRLTAAFDHLEDPQSALDLAELCAKVGLRQLADAWRQEAAHPTRANNSALTPTLPHDTRPAPAR